MEVEIQENQTFYDFHEFIQDELEYDTSHLAIFHVCNHSWQSKQEIALLKKGKTEKEVLLMDKTIMKSFVKDAHQKFQYCYDLINNRCFKIELMETKMETTNMFYPICTAFTGEIPPQFDSGKNDSLFDLEDEEEETIKKPKKPVIDVFDDDFATEEPFDKEIDFGFTPEDQDIEPDEEEEEDVKDDGKDDFDDEDDIDEPEGDIDDSLDDDDE
jgi:hypothetical protein